MATAYPTMRSRRERFSKMALNGLINAIAPRDARLAAKPGLAGPPVQDCGGSQMAKGVCARTRRMRTRCAVCSAATCSSRLLLGVWAADTEKFPAAPRGRGQLAAGLFRARNPSPSASKQRVSGRREIPGTVTAYDIGPPASNPGLPPYTLTAGCIPMPQRAYNLFSMELTSPNRRPVRFLPTE